LSDAAAFFLRLFALLLLPLPRKRRTMPLARSTQSLARVTHAHGA
jgi:hypothetical protein